MRPEKMKAALAKMIDDFWHKGDVDAAYEIYSDDIVFHRVPFPPVVGKEANMQADAGMLAAFTENHTTIDEMIVEGDTAAMRWTWEAVHSGTSPSWASLPRANASVPWDAVCLPFETAKSSSSGSTAIGWACCSRLG